MHRTILLSTHRNRSGVPWSVSYTVPSTTATASILSGPCDHFIYQTTPSTLRLRTKSTKSISRAQTSNRSIPNRLGNNWPDLFALPKPSRVRITFRKTHPLLHHKLHHKPYRTPHLLLRRQQTPCVHTLTSTQTTISTTVSTRRFLHHCSPPDWEASLSRSMRRVAIYAKSCHVSGAVFGKPHTLHGPKNTLPPSIEGPVANGSICFCAGWSVGMTVG